MIQAEFSDSGVDLESASKTFPQTGAVKQLMAGDEATSSSEPAAVDGSVIMSSWGLGDAAFKAAIEVMKAQAGDSEEALANIAMMEPMIRESMGKMMVEIAKDTVTNHSATGVERMPIESLPHEGNRFTLTAKERTIELEWQDPVLLVWEQGVEAMKIP